MSSLASPMHSSSKHGTSRENFTAKDMASTTTQFSLWIRRSKPFASFEASAETAPPDKSESGRTFPPLFCMLLPGPAALHGFNSRFSTSPWAATGLANFTSIMWRGGSGMNRSLLCLRYVDNRLWISEDCVAKLPGLLLFLGGITLEDEPTVDFGGFTLDLQNNRLWQARACRASSRLRLNLYSLVAYSHGHIPSRTAPFLKHGC